jgi:hypothetical protein
MLHCDLLNLGLTFALLPLGGPVDAPDATVAPEARVVLASEAGETSVRFEEWLAGAPLTFDLSLQDDEEEKEEFPDKRKEIRELLKQLKEHVKAKGAEDQEAMTVMERLAEEFKVSGPKDRESIVDGLGDVCEVRRKDKADDVPDEEVHAFAAVMLGRCGKEAGPRLIKLVDHKNLEEKPKARRAAILSLGRSGHPKAKETLIDLLKHEYHYVAGAAAEAMGSLAKLEQDDRKDMVQEIINEMMRLVDALDVAATDGSLGGGNYEQMQQRYDAMSGGAQSSLEALTGANESDFKSWRTWFNNNKKESWD